MENPLLLSLYLAPLGSLGALMATLATYAHYRRHASACIRERDEITTMRAAFPDACRWLDLRERITDSERQLSRLGEALGEARAAIAARDRAEAELRDAKEQLLGLQADREQQYVVRAELEASRRLLETTRADVERAHSELGGLQRQTASATLVRDRLEEEEQELRAARGSAAEKLREVEQQLVAANRRYTEECARLAATEGQRLAKEAALKDANEELAAARSARDAAERERHAIGADVQLLRAQRKQEETLRESAQQELKQLKAELDQGGKNLKSLSAQLAEAEQKAAVSTQNLAALARSLKLSQAEVDKALAEVEKRRGEVAKEQEKLDKARTELAGVEGATRALRAEQKALADSIAALKSSQERLVEQLRQTGGTEESAEAELWNRVFTRKPEQKGLTEQAALESVQEQLRRRGLLFSERTVYAFHTSLKIAEMSPLVVLAGISGTGKSELPLRYADALGMHFLSVPVQPRWDSPQDMFGFFNYLEMRFRPTELTRALIQFDGIKDRRGRGWRKPGNWTDSLADQMLLVLLDEMNLARVEYYFSDFLSKLETRRGVQRSSDEQRSKAEIVLEVGRRKDESSLMRLFVDTNVLFVGTMNEDESTQSLSDKVVDRANVLRFGRPHRLKARSELSDTTVRVMPGLGYQTWKGWLRGDADLARVPGGNERVDAWIARLNEIMSKIGRPFAHRTHQAMRAYAANYPIQSEDGLRWAMSDQIEQRILPKFRGLDPADHGVGAALDSLRTVVRELDDPELQGSIDQARDGHAHQFHWQGVDRAAREAERV